MNSKDVELDNVGMCLKCDPCSIKTGKKYILGLISIKIIVIWYIYFRSNEFWSLVPQTSVSLGKKKDVTLYNVTLFHIPLTKQEDMVPYYIEMSSNVYCFLNGINLKHSKSKKTCQCLSGWHGMDCGIPEAIWKSTYLQEGKKKGVEIRRRIVPRRIISAILFIDEIDFLNIGIQEAFPAVDVFLVIEENATQPSTLYSKLKAGFLSEFQNKIMPISVKKISSKVNNLMQWSLLMLNNMWIDVWNHITDFRPDDLFLFSHVSSILSKDVLLFLKLYDGYPEPFIFELRFIVHNFYRYITKNNSLIQKTFFQPLGCSFQYLYFGCDNNINSLISDICFSNIKLKENYQKNYWKVEKWIIGTQNYPSGWHCYLCSRTCDVKKTIGTHMWIMETFNLSSTSPNVNETDELKKFIESGKLLEGLNINSTLLTKLDKYSAPDIVRSNPLKYSFGLTC